MSFNVVDMMSILFHIWLTISDVLLSYGKPIPREVLNLVTSHFYSRAQGKSISEISSDCKLPVLIVSCYPAKHLFIFCLKVITIQWILHSQSSYFTKDSDSNRIWWMMIKIDVLRFNRKQWKWNMNTRMTSSHTTDSSMRLYYIDARLAHTQSNNGIMGLISPVLIK